MSRILAIDPGTLQSGYCVYENKKVIESGVITNEEIKILIKNESYDILAVEMIASYGMPVGQEVFDTCVWVGRFIDNSKTDYKLVYRRDVKLNLCGSPRAKDPNIRQAIIDRVGAPGTKKNPGPTYGVSSHAWAALGVALTV